MPLRNGPHGYGAVTKALHWLTVSAVLGQFLVGYSLDDDGGGRGRGRGRGGESGRGRGRGGEDDDDYAVLDGEWTLTDLHVALGLTVLGLVVARLLWRATTPLPPWAPALSARERTLESWLEKGLLTSLVLAPLSGLLLVGTGEDDWLPLHVASHVAFFVLVSVHVGLVLRHTVVRRDRHLARML